MELPEAEDVIEVKAGSGLGPYSFNAHISHLLRTGNSPGGKY
jgi:hypothetical protein